MAQSGCGVAQLGCGVTQEGTAWLSYGAAWLRRVQRGSKGCGVAQIVARQLAVRQARVRISARHPRGGTLPSGSYEENKSGRRVILYINVVQYVCSVNVK
jgi:hypothetical protein